MSSGKPPVLPSRKTNVRLPDRLLQGLGSPPTLDATKDAGSSPALPKSDSVVVSPPCEPGSSEKVLESSEGMSSRERPWPFDKRRLANPKQSLSTAVSGDRSTKGEKKGGKPATEDLTRKRKRKEAHLDSAAANSKILGEVDSSVDAHLQKKEKKSSPTPAVAVETSQVDGVNVDTVRPVLPVASASTTPVLTSPASSLKGLQGPASAIPEPDSVTPVNWVPGEDGFIKEGELIIDPSKRQKTPAPSSKTSPLVFANELLDTTRCLDRVVRLYDREVKVLRSKVAELESLAVERVAEKLEVANLRLKEDEKRMGELSSSLTVMRDRCQKLEDMVVRMKDERDAHDASLKKTITRLRGEKCQDLADLERATAEISCYRAVLTKVETHLASRSVEREAEAALNQTLGALKCLKVLRGGREKADYEVELLALRSEQEKLVLGASSLEKSDLIVTVEDVDEALRAEIARESAADGSNVNGEES